MRSIGIVIKYCVLLGDYFCVIVSGLKIYLVLYYFDENEVKFKKKFRIILLCINDMIKIEECLNDNSNKYLF